MDGTEAGKVFVYDDDDPDTFLEEVKWMTQADAEKFAKELITTCRRPQFGRRVDSAAESAPRPQERGRPDPRGGRTSRSVSVKLDRDE